jgi:CTP synthase
MLETGVQPDIIVLRTDRELNLDIRKKVALFCNVDLQSVIESKDVSTIYEVPVLMQKEKLDLVVLHKLGLRAGGQPELTAWKNFLYKLENSKKTVKIGLIGKYVELPDAYKSISESFVHAGASNNVKVDVEWIHSEKITESNYEETLRSLQGILIAPGFGHRGIEGKILAAKYARENNIPFLGICLGMQCAVIEFGRNVLKLEDAHSSEMNRKTPYPVIDLMEEQKGVLDMGGTMRLGSYSCVLKKESKAYAAYKLVNISERHRHRYEFNNLYLKEYEIAGMMATGVNPDSNLVEIVEIPANNWFVGVQFHPEYKSTVLNPHPLFVSFVKAVKDNKPNKK